MIEECKNCSKKESYELEFNARPLDAVIAGVQKAGSTSLLHYLRQHPNLTGHKEIEFDYLIKDECYNRGYDEEARRQFGTIKEEQILLGKAVAATYIREVVRRLYHHNPSCKIVVLIRDPIDRAYSAYWYARKLGWETKTTFEEALQAETKRREKAGEAIRHCSYVGRGKYDEQLTTLYRLFGEENVSVQVFEHFVETPERVCNEVSSFLGLESYAFQPTQKHNAREVPRSQFVAVLTRLLRWNPVSRVIRRVIPSEVRSRFGDIVQWIENENRQKGETPPMNEETRQKLADIFRPHVKRTEDLTGHSLDHWL